MAKLEIRINLVIERSIKNLQSYSVKSIERYLKNCINHQRIVHGKNGASKNIEKPTFLLRANREIGLGFKILLIIESKDSLLVLRVQRDIIFD